MQSLCLFCFFCPWCLTNLLTKIGKRQQEDVTQGQLWTWVILKQKGNKDFMSCSSTVYPFSVPDLYGERQRIHSHIHLAGISTHIPPTHTHWYPSTYTQTLKNSISCNWQLISNQHTPEITSECFFVAVAKACVCFLFVFFLFVCFVPIRKRCFHKEYTSATITLKKKP